MLTGAKSVSSDCACSVIVLSYALEVHGSVLCGRGIVSIGVLAATLQESCCATSGMTLAGARVGCRGIKYDAYTEGQRLELRGQVRRCPVLALANPLGAARWEEFCTVKSPLQRCGRRVAGFGLPSQVDPCLALYGAVR